MAQLIKCFLCNLNLDAQCSHDTTRAGQPVRGDSWVPEVHGFASSVRKSSSVKRSLPETEEYI